MATKKKAQQNTLLWILYPLLAICVVAYIFTNNLIVGLLAFLMFVVVIFFEFKDSVKNEGFKKSAIDVAIALGAVVVLWIVLVLILHTTSPVNVVTSCSMLPTLQRGDVVLLHGISNMSGFLHSYNIPVVNVSGEQYNSMLSNMGSEFLAYYAYLNNNPGEIVGTGVVPAGAQYKVGLYSTKCIQDLGYTGRQDNPASCLVSNATQQDNLIRYSYVTGNITTNGQVYSTVYTQRIWINNVMINENYSNPVIIYRTTSEDYFATDEYIIHRVVAAINVSGTYYLLTKGDNNPGLDMQFSNYPPSQFQVIGYNVLRIPYLGYPKLILSGQLAEPAGCNQTILH